MKKRRTRAVEAAAPPLARLTTGNAELDEILGGGFPANSINVIMGEPGAGKTILAETLLFANADPDGRPVLFLTTLSEPLDKVVRYLQQLAFFDESKMAGSVVYDSLGADLAEHGPAILVPRLRDIITTQKPKIIVIDSFRAIHDVSAPGPEIRKMLFDLAGLLTAYETTAFLVGEYGPDGMGDYPELAVADGILELRRDMQGARDERFLRVVKLRGSRYHEGTHGFRLGRKGLEVFPRLVSPRQPPAYDVLKERVATGIEGLDKMLGKGLLRGRSAFVLGPTGSGKTTLALQFVLEGIRQGEKCMYVSFEENPSQLDAQIRSLGADPAKARAGGLHIHYVSPVELQIDSFVTTVFRAITEQDLRRVAVDAIGDLITAAGDVNRLHGFLYALSQHFMVHGVTSMFPYETLPGDQQRARLSALADTIFVLDFDLSGGKGRRTIRVAKARGLKHDLDLRELRITSKGVQVK